ncbi:unnamed protein product [Durusdinium trenchii]|uniref:Uncharacterized protein n=1 Tax=Durusdinium trenchii TaxID=1381693 RepID=A0ABP0L5K8_9DINO
MLQRFLESAWGPPGQCDIWVTLFSSILCALGLAIACFGYRLYSRAFGLFLFLLAFALEAMIGTQWLQRGSGSLGQKLVISIACLAWALLARAWAPKLKGFLEHVLDITLGAIVGFLCVAVFMDLLASQVGALAPDYTGWDGFAVLTLGIPVAVAVAWHSRGWSKLLFVLATGLLGALLAVGAAASIARCAKSQNPFTGAPTVLLVAAIGALVQWFLD